MLHRQHSVAEFNQFSVWTQIADIWRTCNNSHGKTLQSQQTNLEHGFTTESTYTKRKCAMYVSLTNAVVHKFSLLSVGDNWKKESFSFIKIQLQCLRELFSINLVFNKHATCVKNERTMNVLLGRKLNDLLFYLCWIRKFWICELLLFLRWNERELCKFVICVRSTMLCKLVSAYIRFFIWNDLQ